MKLFVNNLPYQATTQELTDLFQSCGTVLNSRIITDRETRRSRGFGFVEMGSQSEGLTAMQKLDGTMFNGRPIYVREAQERAERPRRERREDSSYEDNGYSSGGKFPDSYGSGYDNYRGR